MNSDLAAEGLDLSGQPSGLNPDSFPSTGTAETMSLQLRWSGWALLPLAFVAAVVAAPYLLNHGFPAIGFGLYRGFAIVCHQRPERSFWIFGGTVAVCSRCLGIYLGAAAGLLFRSSRRIALRLLIAAATLNVLDAVTELAGLHGNWLAVRFVLGWALGATMGLLISSSRTSFSRSRVPSAN